MDYKTSGVDIDAGRAFVKRIKSSVESTHGVEVIGGMGGFGGLIRLPKNLSSPVLVAGTDGVGTKLELAQDYKGHFGVGLDLVAMCVNDVITCGAKPLFFLDYIATGALGPEAMAEVVEGIANGCQLSGCALLGGETAEMPGFYPKGRYDLAGFCVAVIEEALLVDGRGMKDGDQIIGIPSSGPHSNGFSLIRKVLATQDIDELSVFGSQQMPLIEALLRPTTLYVQLVEALLNEQLPLTGMAHITGGGLPENLPRCLPDGLSPFIDPGTWQIPELFRWLQQAGEIPEQDLWKTFNLGVGFCLVVSPEAVQDVIGLCREVGFQAWTMGHVQDSSLSRSGPEKLLGLPFQ